MAFLDNIMNGFWTFVKKEISRISKIRDPQKALKEIKKLDQKVNGPKIKIRKRGNYVYFYEMEVFYNSSEKEGRGKIKEKLGRIEKKTYESKKTEFDAMSKQELKDYLEPYKTWKKKD